MEIKRLRNTRENGGKTRLSKSSVYHVSDRFESANDFSRTDPYDVSVSRTRRDDIPCPLLLRRGDERAGATPTDRPWVARRAADSVHASRGVRVHDASVEKKYKHKNNHNATVTKRTRDRRPACSSGCGRTRRAGGGGACTK